MKDNQDELDGLTLEEMAREITDLRANRKKLVDELVASRKRLTEQDQLLSTSRFTVEALETKLNKSNAEIAEMTDQILSLKNEVDVLKSTLIDANEELALLNADLLPEMESLRAVSAQRGRHLRLLVEKFEEVREYLRAESLPPS